MPNPHLPPEILDYIVDFLHDRPDTLRKCCIVSKSWVPRTRRHLFANVALFSVEELESWMTTFPDPADSPAYHAHTLFIGCPQVVMAANAEAGGWIQVFSHVANLGVCGNLGEYPNCDNTEVSLAPFHGFSSTLKSLCAYSIVLPCRHLFNLIRFSPLLEDLTLTGHDMLLGDEDDPHEPQAIIPSTSPAFTGALELILPGGMENTTRRLLDFPNGLRFWKLTSWWTCEEDLRWIMELVTGCSDTLKCLDVRCGLHSTFVSIPCRVL